MYVHALVMLMAFFAIICLLLKIVLAIKLDVLRRRNITVFLKFLFGVYALTALLPILRKSISKEDAILMERANVLLLLFYGLTLSMFAIIFIVAG